MTCFYCGESEGEGVCVVCKRIISIGKNARMGMSSIEQCPWYRGDPLYASVFGPRQVHNKVHHRCPWCDGWGEAEQSLFDSALYFEPGE